VLTDRATGTGQQMEMDDIEELLNVDFVMKRGKVYKQ
jgi:hypothetical protein